MFPNMAMWLKIVLSAALSFAISLAMTPQVKRFAEAIGAMDVPKDERRVHNHPIPRMGGLAIFMGFLASILIFSEMDTKIMGMLIGATIIVGMGAVDDIVSLNAWVKLGVQVVAALVVIRCGVVFDAISNPNVLSDTMTISVGWLAIPLTLLWIVGCTNAVNLIDGLDGLAVGVSAISSLTMLVVSLFVSEPTVAVVLGALTGACLGFIPYNLNPAKIFMGDVGSQFLGFVLAVMSMIGLFKLHTLITFLVPLMALAIPLADTTFAFCRRILHGQSPFHADKGHFHHRLLAMGLNQKQAVAVLYGISAVLGLLAVLIAGASGVIKIVCIVIAFLIAISVWMIIFLKNPNLRKPPHGKTHEGDAPESLSNEDKDTDKIK